MALGHAGGPARRIAGPVGSGNATDAGHHAVEDDVEQVAIVGSPGNAAAPEESAEALVE